MLFTLLSLRERGALYLEISTLNKQFGGRTASMEDEHALRPQCPVGVHFASAEEHPVFAENRDVSARASDRNSLTLLELRRQPRLQNQARPSPEKRFGRQEPLEALRQPERLERVQ